MCLHCFNVPALMCSWFIDDKKLNLASLISDTVLIRDFALSQRFEPRPRLLIQYVFKF